MKTILLASAAAAVLAWGTAAEATVFNFDIQFWSGVGTPSDAPAEEDFAHIIVDDYWGGTISNHGHPTGIWTYGEGSYFGLPYDSTYIDIYNDYWGGGFTLIPYRSGDGDPDYDYLLDIQGPSVLSGTPGDYHIMTGVYDYDYYGQGAFRVTITEAAVEDGVPEPASWAMMVGGFGLIGGVMRRRRRTTICFS